MKKTIEKILFSSKWLLIPFFAGLMVALVVYCYLDMHELYDLVTNFRQMKEEDGMIMILKLVDMAMIANLVKMIITGSYTSFVSKTHDEEPEKVSSGLLKVKMATSLIGVSSIHMLQAFIAADTVNFDTIYKLLVIHGGFIIGAVALAWIDYIHEASPDHSQTPTH